VDLMEQRVRLDLWYINNWSMWLDIRILVQTMISARRREEMFPRKGFLRGHDA